MDPVLICQWTLGSGHTVGFETCRPYSQLFYGAAVTLGAVAVTLGTENVLVQVGILPITGVTYDS